MCIHNPNFIQLSEIVGYKVMRLPSIGDEYEEGYDVISVLAGNGYRIHGRYKAGQPMRPNVVRSPEYKVGFHAYANEKDAWENMAVETDLIVQVILYNVFFEGFEIVFDDYEKKSYKTFVAEECTFRKIIHKPTVGFYQGD